MKPHEVSVSDKGLGLGPVCQHSPVVARPNISVRILTVIGITHAMPLSFHFQMCTGQVS